MTEQEKEIQSCYEKYAKQGLKDTNGMTVDEEKKYIDKIEPRMKREIKEIIKKYEGTNK